MVLAGRVGLAAVIALACAGCGPDRRVLASQDGGDPDTDAADFETFDGEIPCAHDEECPFMLVCETNHCVECTLALSHCADPCPPSTTRVPEAKRNGCVVCACVPTSECNIGPDCGFGNRCVSGKCMPCDPPDPTCAAAKCPPGLLPLPTKTNGCEQCVCTRPTDECHSDAECGGPPMRCYPGAACDDGCGESPACCHGNVCGPTGCKSPAYEAPCVFDGCPQGLTCHTTCGPTECKCNPTTGWECSPPCGGAMCTSDP